MQRGAPPSRPRSRRPFPLTKEPFHRVFCCTIGKICLACGGIHDPQHATKGCEGPVVPPGWRAVCSMTVHAVLGAIHDLPSSDRWYATPCAHTAMDADGIEVGC